MLNGAMADHPLLFLPGPTEVERELREIMARPLVGHRSKGFTATAIAVCKKLQTLFGTASAAAFETCPATALMEAAIRNGVPRGGRCLHLTAGAFGERWAKIAQTCGRRPDALTAPWGSAHAAEPLRAHLRQHGPYAAICITHNETSTGAIEPLAELAAAARAEAPDALLLVDVVTSFAGVDFAFDRLGLDLVFAGTQKCLALPPGLTVWAASERALARAAGIEERGFLLDLPRAAAETMAGKTLATPCVPLVQALDRQLDRVLAEGLATRAARHRAMRDAVLAWAARAGIAPYVADAAARSPTVSCLQASGHDVEALAARALAAGFQIDKGYGDLKGKTFRIGHMGDHTVERVQQLLTALLP